MQQAARTLEREIAATTPNTCSAEFFDSKPDWYTVVMSEMMFRAIFGEFN
jgi:hypothetical protein